MTTHPCPPTPGPPTVLGSGGPPCSPSRHHPPTPRAQGPGVLLPRFCALSHDGPAHLSSEICMFSPSPLFKPIRPAIPPASGPFPTGLPQASHATWHRGDRPNPELPPPPPLRFSVPPHPRGIQAQSLDLPCLVGVTLSLPHSLPGPQAGPLPRIAPPSFLFFTATSATWPVAPGHRPHRHSGHGELQLPPLRGTVPAQRDAGSPCRSDTSLTPLLLGLGLQAGGRRGARLWWREGVRTALPTLHSLLQPYISPQEGGAQLSSQRPGEWRGA